jgi:capsular exopolysaccharide synthesis family protein
MSNTSRWINAASVPPNGDGSGPAGGGWTPAHNTSSQPAWAEPRETGVLEQLVHIFRKRKWVILSAAILVPAIVLALSLSQEKSYTATASLLFHSAGDSVIPGQGGGAVDPTRESATNTSLVSLPQIADRAARKLGGGVTGTAIAGKVKVDVAGSDSDVATIQATDTSPAEAARIANAYAQAFIAFKDETDSTRIRRALRTVEHDLAQLNQAERNSTRGQALATRAQDLRLAQAARTGSAELVQQAKPPSDPSSPKIKRNVALALLLGLALGIALASLLERVDRRIKSLEELEEIYDLPVIAKIPRSRSLGGRAKNQQPTRVLNEALAHTEEAEAFRTLRANLRYFNVDRPVKSVLVASPLPGEGKSTVAAYLAVTMAAMGDNVCLVEADLRKAGGGGPLSDLGSEGLSLVLAGFDLDEALAEVPVAMDVVTEEPRTLTRLPPGPLPPNPSELLESTRMKTVLRQLEERFDYVIIDSPALSSVSDALALVSEVSGVAIVSGLSHTTRHAALGLRKQMSLLGGHPLGVIANFASSEGSDYYYGPYDRTATGARR